MTYDERMAAQEEKSSWFSVPKIPGVPIPGTGDKMMEGDAPKMDDAPAMDAMMWTRKWMLTASFKNLYNIHIFKESHPLPLHSFNDNIDNPILSKNR